MAVQHTRPKIVLVTGPSGAGRSTAINAFEDMGFETIASMPLALLPRLLTGPVVAHSMALGIDVRTRDFEPLKVLDLLDTIEGLAEYDATLLFLDCTAEALLRRYSETRRRHPLAPDEAPVKGIEKEKNLLEPLRDRAEVLIETTDFTPHDLKAEIGTVFAGGTSDALAVSVQSFSYKRGVPRGIDMMLDCRFLRNPHWQETLRVKSGLDPEVKAYVTADERYDSFFNQLVDMVMLLLPAYQQEGKAHFSIGLGCTGGQHRSVAITEELSNALAARGWRVSIRHREIERRKFAQTG
ncbi:MAG: RNase adapter RapZ [Rhodobacteraceae bacterium]|nr:RNase adapter RapZ [Paracoccaceae bacterium]